MTDDQKKNYEEAEEWRAVPGYDGRYLVSSYGHVRSTGLGKTTGAILKQCMRSKYRVVRLAKGDGTAKSYSVHRLVGLCFVPNPNNKPHINHKDHNKLNNFHRNLEWVTLIENTKDATIHQLMARGSKNPSSRLHESQIPIIRDALTANFMIKDVARYFRVSATVISNILHKKAWKHIS